MGDRCYCSIKFIGIISHTHVSHLAEALLSAGVADYKASEKKKIEAEIIGGESCFEFYEVNHAQLDGDLASACHDLKLSYIWHNDSGDDYGEGDCYYDARTDEMIDYNLSGGSICLTLEEIDQNGVLDAARKWQKFATDCKFFAYSSNHQLLAAQSSGQLPEGYFDLLSEIEIAA